jgi:hypothetical protein
VGEGGDAALAAVHDDGRIGGAGEGEETNGQEDECVDELGEQAAGEVTGAMQGPGYPTICPELA